MQREQRLSQLEDGQLLLVADRLNGGEVEQARATLPKLVDPDARDFAEQMFVEHQAVRDRLLQLSDAEDEPCGVPARRQGSEGRVSVARGRRAGGRAPISTNRSQRTRGR